MSDVQSLAGSSRPPGAVAARTGLWLALSAWVGSWLCFALVVAPLAFRVLPSAEVAGSLVSPSLALLHVSGAVAAVIVAALGAGLGRGKVAIGLPLVLAALTLASEYGVTPQLADLRNAAFGPDGNVEAAAAYRRLHGISMSLFSVVLLGALFLVGWHARLDTPKDSGPDTPNHAGSGPPQEAR
ncbi:MAG: DUF4149 domain-containing protein [Myxococcota bacterium]